MNELIKNITKLNQTTKQKLVFVGYSLLLACFVAGDITMTNFRQELESLINKNNMENGSNTPDFILADYLNNCLHNFDRATKARDEYYDRGGGENTIELLEEEQTTKSS